MSEYLQFVAVKDSSNSLVTLKKDLDETIEDILTDFLNHKFKRSKSAWTVKTAEIKDICEEIENILYAVLIFFHKPYHQKLYKLIT